MGGGIVLSPKTGNRLARGGGVWNRTLSIVLALAILGALAGLVYIVTIAKSGERFTEFYLLGLTGEARDFPDQLSPGEEGRVIVGMINREQEAVTYRVEVLVGGVISNQVGPVTLEADEKWEEVVGFTPDRAGDRQKAEFWLYKQGQSQVYQKLYLWLDVR